MSNLTNQRDKETGMIVFRSIAISFVAFLIVTIVGIAAPNMRAIAGVYGSQVTIDERVMALEAQVAEHDRLLREHGIVPKDTPEPVLPVVTEPPHSLGAASYYQKYLNAGGVPVLAPENVSDEEMQQVRTMMISMLANRTDLFAIMVQRGFRVGIYNAYSANLKQLPEFAEWKSQHTSGGFKAVQKGNSIMGVPEVEHHCNPVVVHEFAHMVDYAIDWQDYGQNHNDFDNRLEEIYQAAMAAGLWQNSFASLSKGEYWAWTVEYWFRSDVFEAEFGIPTLAQYDPVAAELIESVFGDAALPDFCQMEQVQIGGKLTDSSGQPVSDTNITLMLWSLVEGYIYPLNWIASTEGEAVTEQDGSFEIAHLVEKTLLDRLDNDLFFTVGAYKTFDRSPGCSVAGYFNHGKMVKSIFSAQKIDPAEQGKFYDVQVPNGFDWSPEELC